MSKLKNILLFIFLINFANIAFSQFQNDLQLWTELALSKKINKKLELTLSEEFRFHQNISALEQFLVDFCSTYKINKYIYLGANYRFTMYHKGIEVYENSNRFNFDAKFKYDFDRFGFYYRMRVQSEFESFRYVPVYDFFENKLRNKINLNYDFNKSKIEPFVSIETFTSIQKTDFFNVYKIWATAGIGFEKMKIDGLNIFYRYERDFSKMPQNCNHIIGISYAFNL